ncbi:acetolactate synthase large subunit [Solirubrobacter sp. CPCC 204708]|uniref:Acetolactate synthase large subunit n=1 Tax=Solirubrobacter deserti TaxID=2282478 RepID=A0ABT4RBT3_9ACTN|nr:acetolactate synthase large subunit [Solirubrobacter deserti]MBE2317119.1 acetolactate synthase large subunit [Solirubrobacter deserti]MDA0135989.1 acetolactate synthase large subunit [Solirubrobacter deserti]
MSSRKASDLFVECLEAEGVEYVFGIPGEETLDLNESLHDSSIKFVPVRHEQGGAYMADMYGRLTQRAGVCLGTLGPGATNLTTAIADAFLDRSPLVALTGQADLQRMHKESHQHIDIVSMFKPITKWNTRLNAPEVIPEVVRKAFKVAQEAKPGATHIELPEDVMAGEVDAVPLPSGGRDRRLEPSAGDVLAAAELIRNAANPIALAGNGVARAGAANALREFARATGIGVAETFMGKGALDYEDSGARGTVGLQSRDYALAGFEDADVVITIGYDLVEHAPSNWNPKRDKQIVCIDSVPSEVDEHFITQIDLVGDLYHILSRLTEELRHEPRTTRTSRLDDIVLGRFEAAKHDDAFPMQPPRALWEIRQALGRHDMLISDVGLHKLWIARMFPAHEPNTVLIANGLAGMGIALPTAIAAKLVHPGRNVVTVNGDGGFLMNVQELETAVRLKTPIVNIIWENAQFGSIVWKQDKKFGRHFGTDFTNPDFVKLADAFGMPAWRCESVEDFGSRLRHALSLELPSLIVVPIDYSLDVSISEELGTETVAA